MFHSVKDCATIIEELDDEACLHGGMPYIPFRNVKIDGIERDKDPLTYRHMLLIIINFTIQKWSRKYSLLFLLLPTYCQELVANHQAVQMSLLQLNLMHK